MELETILTRLGLDSWKGTLINIFCVIALYGGWKAIDRLWIQPFVSPLRDLPGPKSPSFIWGNLREIFSADPGELHDKWVEQYGTTFSYTGLLRSRRFITLDWKALGYVLNHNYKWEKPQEVRESLAQLLGEGILFAEGGAHKRQRRVMNPSFAPSHIRELTEIFHAKSQQLRNILLANTSEEGGSYTTNIMIWLGKATLDIIGLAGFDYEFNALNPEGNENELSEAFNTFQRNNQRIGIIQLAQAFFPFLRILPTQQRKHILRATEVMDRIGHELVHNKRQMILAEAAARGKGEAGQTYVEKSVVTSKDLLSRLMMANMADDLPENQRLSDHDMMAQIPTFLIAGHETTATASTWCLYSLCLNPVVQQKLREELLNVDTDTPTMDEINALPYLDAVIKETMRVHAAVPSTARVAVEDDVLPLATPFKDRNGVLRHELRIRKGDRMFIPIITANRLKDIWGEDAHEFKPERWLNPPSKASEVPGVVSGLLSFTGGPRSCIGYRFALVEFKCIMFALIRSLQFELAVPVEDIRKRSTIVTRPVLKSQPKNGPQLPLKITPYKGV